MQVINGWDSVVVKEFGNDPRAGGHVLGCLASDETLSKEKIDRPPQKMLLLKFDICEGPFKNYYRELSQKLGKGCYLRKYVITEGEQVARFKGVITSFEKSNLGFKWNWDEKKLIRLKIGACLQAQPYINAQGFQNEVLKIFYFCSTERVYAGDVKIPPPLPLENNNRQSNDEPYNIPAHNDDDLPF